MVKGTREKIVHSFISLAAKYPERYDFSLAEIAKEARITRQAIYKNHFNNSKEIIKYIRRKIDTEILNVLNTYSEEEDAVLFFAEKVLPILHKNRDWLRILYSTAIDPNWRTFLVRRYKKWLTKHLKPHCAGLSEEFAANLFLNYILVILGAWLTQDFPAPPKVFAKQFVKLLEMPMSEFIRR